VVLTFVDMLLRYRHARKHAVNIRKEMFRAAGDSVVGAAMRWRPQFGAKVVCVRAQECARSKRMETRQAGKRRWQRAKAQTGASQTRAGQVVAR
jgi:hypothetical protein